MVLSHFESIDIHHSPVSFSTGKIALQNNRDLRVAILNVEAYQAQYRIQRAAQLPTIAASGAQTRQLSYGAISNKDTATIGISAYELDLYGRLKNLKIRALKNYLAQEETQRSTQLTLIANVATAYMTLLADQDLVTAHRADSKKLCAELSANRATLSRRNIVITRSQPITQQFRKR